MNLPVLIYDGDCSFCQRQALRLSAWSGGHMKLESFRDPGVPERYGLSAAACEGSVQFIRPDGKVFAGAAAAAEALKLNPSLSWLSGFYRVPGLKQVAEAVYHWVARNRFHIR